jgi:hypothetical protein
MDQHSRAETPHHLDGVAIPIGDVVNRINPCRS